MSDLTDRLQLTGICKQYPGTLANDSIHLTIKPGETHALLGENGAGKSTLMKIIYGVIKPDAGTIHWEGQAIQIRDPAQARALGIGMVFQHFSLFETLTVKENIALALGPQAGNPKTLSHRIRDISNRYGMALEPNRPVHSLSTGERQRVEIVRCLIQDIKLLILDEPTSVLTPQEAENLFTTLRQLAREGCSILFISHKLHEVKSLCTHATILRGGRITGECNPQLESTQNMARMMVGDETPINTTYAKATGGKTFLSLKQLSQPRQNPFATPLKNINLDVCQGEIVGIAGVAGNGQEALLTALSGEVLSKADSICFPDGSAGQDNPTRRRSRGMAFVPEDRLGRGAVSTLSLHENGLLTGFLHGLINKGFINKPKTRQFAQQIIQRFNVKASGVEAQADSLSGGNLQKFIIGREILQKPKLLIAAHPTWGVDVGAASAIHKALIELRDQGTAILVISEDTDELFQIADRIGALFAGELSPLKPVAQTNIEEVGAMMAGVFQRESQA